MQIIPVWGQSECMFSSVPQKLNSGTSNNKNLHHTKKLSITKNPQQSPSLIEANNKTNFLLLEGKTFRNKTSNSESNTKNQNQTFPP